MKSKRCSACGTIRSREGYYHPGASKCVECYKQYQREYRKRVIETKEQRRQRYIKESITSGMRYRVGLKYVFDSPINDFKKCSHCKKYLPRESFGNDKRSKDGKRTICKPCISSKHKEKYVPHPRKRRTKDEIRKHDRNYMRVYNYLLGDGCCLYCGETNFWKLNNHHPWKKADPNFTITLCENHHAPLTRGMPFVLDRWHTNEETEKNNR